MQILIHFFVALAALQISSALAQSGYHIAPTNYGGRLAMSELVKNEMFYPPEALEQKISGKVTLRFTIMPDGTAVNPEVSERVHPLLDAEALRLFEMILWEPALRDGKAVKAAHEISFDFKARRYPKLVKQRGYDSTYDMPQAERDLNIYQLSELSAMPKPVFEKDGQKYADFITENLQYPEAAIRQNLTGTVEVFFVVEPSGRPSNIKVLKGIGAGCNEEAIRLAGLLRWQPGMKNGIKVRSEMTLNITFNLPGSENIRYVPANNQNQF